MNQKICMEDQKKAGFSGLTGTALKMIALVCMLLDHIHYFFGFTGKVPMAFSVIGRLAAPLFLFCLAEGFTYTSNRKRFFFQIYLIAMAMSALLFGMTFCGILVRPDGFYPQNGMMTTFAILIVIWQGIDWIREKRWLRGILAIALPLLWPMIATKLMVAFPVINLPLSLVCATVLPIWGWLSPETGLPILIMGTVLYLFRKNRILQVAAFVFVAMAWDFALTCWMASQMPDFAFSHMFTRYYEWMEVFAAPLMLCYNGQRGRGYKTLFYAFYPVHLVVLYALSWGLYLLMR